MRSSFSITLEKMLRCPAGLGGPGARPGQFNNPWAIALDSHGNLFVADAGNHRVQKLARRQEVGALSYRMPNVQ